MEIAPGGAPDTGREVLIPGTFPMVASAGNGRVLAWLDGEAVHLRIEGER